MLKLDLWKLLLDLKSVASDILRYIFEPAEWIRYIAIYFTLPSEYDTWPADKPPIYLQKSFISIVNTTRYIFRQKWVNPFFVSENVKEIWLNDLFWGIRAHCWGKLSFLGDK